MAPSELGHSCAPPAPDLAPAAIRHRLGLLAILLCLLLWGFGSPARAEGRLDAQPIRVAKIIFLGVEDDLGGLRAGIVLEEGGVFDESLLEKSIVLLRRKAIFSRVDADYRITPAGAEVTFSLEPMPRLSRIRTSGNRAIPSRKIRREARIQPGELLTEERVSYAVKRIRRLYEEEGFENAKVGAQVIRRDGARSELLLSIVENAPLIVEEVRFSGDPVFSVRRLRQLLPIRERARLRQKEVRAGREKLLDFYRRRGYFDAEVEEHFRPVVGTRGTLFFSIAAGKPWCLRIEGNKALGDEELLELMNVYRRPVITAGTWRELARRIETAYREEGFARAQVEAKLTRGKKRCVVIRVEEGPRVRIGKVNFKGNVQVPTRVLRRSMSLSGPRLFFLRKPVFSQNEIDAAVERLAGAYRARGFLEVRLRPNLSFAPDGKSVDIVVEIDEGPRYFVSAIEVEGEIEGETPRLPKEVAVGLPYSDAVGKTLRRSILAQLRQRGHEQARVKVVAERGELADNGRPVTLRACVEAGPVFHVGAITIAGNTFTRDEVVRREIELGAGEALDRKKLGEEEENIYRLGLFRSAKLEVLPDSVTADPLARDILVRVRERPAGNLEYGAGYNTRDGLRSFAELSHGNFRGSGRRVSLRGDLGFDAAGFVPNEYLANAGVRIPRALDSRFTLLGNVIPVRSERDVDEFSVERVTVLGGVERRWGSAITTTWQLEFEDGRVFDVSPDAQLSATDEGRLMEVTFNPLTVLDTRDDVFVPTRGLFESLRVRYGAPAMGSDIHFLKLNAQHAHYLSLGGGVVGMYSARFGYARLLGAGGEVPIRERFFLGGRTSVRGFSENEIGPHGELGSPQGGDLLINLNSELRFPLLGALHGAVFLDAGGLYLARRSVSLGDFRRSAGAGLRYMTPIGPLSLDYGLKLDRRGRESIGQLHFSIGTVF